MPLFQVTVSVTMMVLADDEEDATDTAQQYACDELRNGYAQTDIDCVVKTLADVPLFERNSIPWGGAQDKTCRQILDEAEPPVPPAVLPGQEKLPGLETA